MYVFCVNFTLSERQKEIPQNRLFTDFSAILRDFQKLDQRGVEPLYFYL